MENSTRNADKKSITHSKKIKKIIKKIKQKKNAGTCWDEKKKQHK